MPKVITLTWGIEVQNILNFDVSGFYMAYNNRPGLILKTDAQGNPYTLRTNIANSVHQGIESYIELDILPLLRATAKAELRIYNSFSFLNAKYTSGEYKGNEVAYAPKLINRIGITYAIQGFSTSFQWSGQSRQYTDAANTVASENPLVGIIPAYQVVDWSATLKIKQFNVKGGINNVTNNLYFTQRTDEYPGPGIIPSIGRSFYVGLGATLF